MTFYHGAYDLGHTAHEGICLTDDESVAAAYGRNIYSAEMDMRSLRVEACEGYDHDEDDAPADHAAFRAAAATRGVDVLTYEDEDQMGRVFTCYRLISERAVAACLLTLTDDEEDDDE